jgi:sugar phosphate isomerase/epimerase
MSTPMKFAICNEIYSPWPFEDVLAHAAQTGYQAVEVAPFTLAPDVNQIGPEQRRQLRAAAARAGIDVSGIHWVLAQTQGLHLTHPDPQVRARTASYFSELVRFCADIGGHYIIVGSPKQRSLLPGVTQEQARDHAREVLADAVRHAEDRTITLCLEPLSPTETDFINTAAEAIGFTSTIGSPALKIILDVKAMCSEAIPIPDIIAKSWPHFAYFHANDRNLKGPGFGDVDYRPIVAALRQVGYDGTVSVEVFQFDEGPELIATRSLEYLRSVFGTAGENAG